MNLAIICTMINSFGRRGFYNTQEIGLGKALVSQGHNVTIYKCLKKSGKMQKEKIEIQPGLTIWYLPIRGIGAHGYLRTSILRKDLDGVLCFSDNQVFVPHIYRFCKRNGIYFVPYVGAAHSQYDGLHAKIMNRWFAMGTLKIFKKSRVMAKTDGAKRELMSFGVTDITIAPVGLDADVLKRDFKECDKTQLRKEFGFAPDDILLCDVCRLEDEKRPLELIELFMHIKDRKNFKLLIVGEGPLRQKIDEKIKEYGIENVVKIIERIPYAEMWKIYSMSDYFINLNKGEIYGMAILEAVFYETSVAALKSAPGPSVILKQMHGHCLCEDDRQIESWLMGEYPSEKDLEESSQKIIRDFTWDSCANTFSAIVEQGLKSQSSGRGLWTT